MAHLGDSPPKFRPFKSCFLHLLYLSLGGPHWQLPQNQLKAGQKLNIVFLQ